MSRRYGRRRKRRGYSHRRKRTTARVNNYRSSRGGVRMS
jgi:hypothetical protein